MKNFTKHFLFGMLSLVFSWIPTGTSALTMQATYNSSSTISIATYLVTCDDGTVLGFYKYNSTTAYFVGAITDAVSVVVPDTVVYSNYTMAVTGCGYCGYPALDFDEAPNITSLTLPATVTYIYNSSPVITELHLQSTTPPFLYYDFTNTTIYVPQSAYETYLEYCENNYNGWSFNCNVIYVGWTPNVYTIKIPSAGQFGQKLLEQVERWTDVDELIVIGSMNNEDMELISRMTRIQKLDLSQTNITSIGGCSNLRKLKTVLLPTTINLIEEEAFYSCESLKFIEFPTSIEFICNNAFSHTGLTSVVIPEGCTYIEEYAFENCPLDTISIPSTIKSLSSDAFYDVSNVKVIYCYAVAPFATDAFSNMSDATLYVPEFSMNAYLLHDDWSHFNQTIAIEGNIQQLNIYSDFTLYDYNGLADKVDVTLAPDYIDYDGDYSSVALTVNANAALSVGNYVQYIDFYYALLRYYDDDLDQYCERYLPSTSLITQNEITADNMCTHVYVHDGRWNFISFPYDVNVSDIVVPEGILWVIRKYSGADRAAMTGNTWQNMTDGMVLKAGEGYIFHCYDEEDDEVCVSFPSATNDAGTLFAYEDVVKTLSEYPSEYAHNRSWNLVGNPYPSYFNTQEIEFDAPITVWNGSGYTAYSLLDDNYVLTPNEAFFVQCPTTSTTMTFHKEGRMHLELSDYVDYAPSFTRMHNVATSRFVYNFLLTDAAYTDRARLVVNEEAKVEYEANCDASKFMSSNTAIPQLYINESGVKYAINERPLDNGPITLGAYFGKAGEHTLTLASNPNEGTAVMLTDHLTGIVTDLTAESYTFTAEAGTDNNRFTIALANTTDIESGVAAESTESQIYTLDGKQVVDTENLPAGVYLVKKGDEYVKHVVKE